MSAKRQRRRVLLALALAGRRLCLLRPSLAVGIVLAVAAMPMGCAQINQDDPQALAQDGTPTPLARVPSFAPVVEKVLPAVVDVSATFTPSASIGEGKGDSGAGEDVEPPTSPLDELLRRFFEQELAPRSRLRRVSVGSGFIIDAAGYIVTNNHVIKNAAKVTVMFQGDMPQEARIVGRDSMTDLALLKITAPHPLPYVSWGNSDTARVGDWVLAVGNAFGFGGTVSFGIVSARGRDIHAGPYDDFLQIDAAINRGHSGGPAFNLDGQVIGITTAIATSTGGSVGIAFAIPSNFAKPIIEQLRDHGKVTRGWLGIELQEMTPELARGLGLPKEQGVLVADVSEHGPGEKAGFRQGDVILSFNGHGIQRLRDLPLLLAESPVGQRGTAKVWRSGREITLSPVVEEMPESRSEATQDRGTRGNPEAERTRTVSGLTLAPLTEARRQRLRIPSDATGVLVLSIAAGSPFSRVDVEAGDVIETINRQPVSTPQDAAEKIRAALAGSNGNVLMLLNRNGTRRFVALSVDRGVAGSSAPKRQ